MQITPEFMYLFSYGLVILMKIVCFIISYKIVRLGYALVQAGVKGEFKFSAEFSGIKADLVSLSPGLLFVLLGVMFMMVAIYVNKTITYTAGNAGAFRPTNTITTTVDSAAVPDTSDFIKQFKQVPKTR